MPIREWLVDQSLSTGDIVEMFDSLCRRLVAIGIPLARARLIWPTLHPLFSAETVQWDIGQPARLEQFAHQDNETDTWKRSPLKFVIENEVEVFRRQLDGPNQMLDFEILGELKEMGMTDYLIQATKLEEENSKSLGVKSSRGILVTYASERKGGFSADDLVSLHQIQKRFAVACKTIIQKRISQNITTTYLGRRAGNSVLEGQIRLGDGERTKAVVWYSDLRDSTSHAETMEPDAYFSMLNSYFQSTAGTVVAHGGEVLDFIGDAVLGIFPYDQDRELKTAAQSANKALDQTIEMAKEANLERESLGLQRFKYGVGLNVGEVMFGNIGIPERLSFSVIGPTVNEVARIEQMTKLLQQPILASKELAELDPKRWKSMGEHKLEGMLEEQELFSFRFDHAA